MPAQNRTPRVATVPGPASIRHRRGRISGLCLALLLAPPPASAITGIATPESRCDMAAERAARHHGIPRDVLMAITRAETGRTRNGVLTPWPWAVNLNGKGHWFADRDSARAFVQSALDQGHRNIDVGCFQLNYRWHGQAFASVEQMFDPDHNASYAAGFLGSLRAEFPDWVDAAGAYHSRNEPHAGRYRERFGQIWRALSPGPPDRPVSRRAATGPTGDDNRPRPAADPWGGGRPLSPGSLVPLDPAGAAVRPAAWW